MREEELQAMVLAYSASQERCEQLRSSIEQLQPQAEELPSLQERLQQLQQQVQQAKELQQQMQVGVGEGGMGAAAPATRP
jgi:prefoldin subunit 5